MKVGDKYIIEIEEVIRRNGAPQIARVKGFNALVFDKYGLEKLEPYDGGEKIYRKGYVDGINAVMNESEKKHNSDLDYKDGLEDGRMEAWECAKKIYKMTASEIITVFGGCSNWVDYSVDEAIAKIKEYEEQQEQFAVGDEVYSDAFDNKGIVTHITADKVACVCIICNGSTMMKVGLCGLRKTGRHFPQIIEVLEQMKGEADGK